MTTETQRCQNRERQQRFRDRQKLSREEIEHANKVNEDGRKERAASGHCFLGEVSPGIDADNVADALQVAREMARAIGSADVQQRETLLDFERRTFDAWARYNYWQMRSRQDKWGNINTGHGGGPFLNRQTQELSPGWGKDYWLDNGGFDAKWVPLPGSDAVIDVSSLPELPPIPEIVNVEPTSPVQPLVARGQVAGRPGFTL
jgi:hypothetical protein